MTMVAGRKVSTDTLGNSTPKAPLEVHLDGFNPSSIVGFVVATVEVAQTKKSTRTTSLLIHGSLPKSTVNRFGLQLCYLKLSVWTPVFVVNDSRLDPCVCGQR